MNTIFSDQRFIIRPNPNWEAENKAWERHRKKTYKKNKKLIDWYHSLPWWKKWFVSFDDIKMQVIRNWDAHGRYPKPRLFL